MKSSSSSSSSALPLSPCQTGHPPPTHRTRPVPAPQPLLQAPPPENMPARQLARPPATTRPARGPLPGHRRPPLEADVARLPAQVGRPGGLDRARAAAEPAERDCAGGLVVRGGSAARGLLVVGRAGADGALPMGGLGFCFRVLLPVAAEARRWGVGSGLGGSAVDGDVGGARGWLGGGEGFVVGGTGFVFPEAVEGVGARGWLRVVGGRWWG